MNGDTNQTVPAVGPVIPPFPQVPQQPQGMQVPSFEPQSPPLVIAAVPVPQPQSQPPMQPVTTTVTTTMTPAIEMPPQPVIQAAPNPFTQPVTPQVPVMNLPQQGVPSFTAPAVGQTSAASSDFKPESEGTSKLPLLVAGILLILALAGGYFLYTLYQMPAKTEEVPVAPVVAPTEAVPTPTVSEEEQSKKEVEELNNVSSSDEVTDIEKDVDNTDLTTLDDGLETQ